MPSKTHSAPIDTAVRYVRHAVQDHGDEGTIIGEPVHPTGMTWMAAKCGWNWPSEYSEFLGNHDGVSVGPGLLYSFQQSLSTFLILADTLDADLTYWPVSGDGCGNYFLMRLSPRSVTANPIMFADMIEGVRAAVAIAPSYAAFVLQQARAACNQHNCLWTPHPP